ncbi:hypothetical protein QQF64_026692, partial [Cirrhinus molitorella]
MDVQECENPSRSVAADVPSDLKLLRGRLDGSFYEIMWVDFEIDNFINLRSSQSIRWQIEYPSTGASAEVISTIYISQRDLQGIVPIAEDTEILNTAILTGRRVAIPVKVVTVEQDGTVREVDDPVTCISTDEDVLKRQRLNRFFSVIKTMAQLFGFDEGKCLYSLAVLRPDTVISAAENDGVVALRTTLQMIRKMGGLKKVQIARTEMEAK